MSSPVFGQLESSLAEYLADVTRRARHADDRMAASVARYEVPKLVEALMAVLAEHAPDRCGRCPNCRSSRFGRTPAPCRADLSAHLCLVAADDEPSALEATTPMRRPVILSEPSGLRPMNASG